jgi:hypothetical protein
MLDSEIPCDFLAYLEWRLGQSSDTTTKLLAEWLATYRPEGRPLAPDDGALCTENRGRENADV